jgi:uncharacterized RmlC-like cupin family protein
MEELNLAGYKGFRFRLDPAQMQTLYTQVLAEFATITPAELRTGTDQSAKVGYQWAKSLPSINDQILPALGQAHAVDHGDYIISDSWLLLQTNEAWIDNPIHTHHGSGSMTAVVYVMADPSHDSISFFDDAGNETRIPVATGDLLLFPAIAPHKPNPTGIASYRRVSYNCVLYREEPVTPESQSRMDICNACDRLMQPVKICKECMCFMPAKTLIPIVECPLGKWGKIDAKNIFGR